MNTILVLAGSFCPIHNNHINMLVSAKQFLENKGIVVEKAYIVPNHKHSLLRKHKYEPISSYHRKKLCKLAVKEYEWIKVYTDLIDCNENFGIKKAIDIIKENNKHFIIQQVCGPDSVILNRKSKPMPLCIVNRFETSTNLNPNSTVWIEYPVNISSSIIRHQVHHNLSIVDWVSNNCDEYINSNKYDFQLTCEPLISQLKNTDVFLGVGAQSVVKLMLLYSNPVAVKVIKFDKTNTLRDFMRELSVLNKLSDLKSQFTVKFLGEYHNEMFGCFVFEYGTPYLLNINDETFRTTRLVKKEDFEEFFDMFDKVEYNHVQLSYSLLLNDKKRYCLDLVNAIIEIHTAGVLHRDVKTENLIIVSNRLKLCDFGVSKFEKDPIKIPRGHMRQYPLESICRFNGHVYDKISEIYMLGATLYNILYGKSIYFDLGNSIADITEKQKLKEKPKCTKIDGKVEKYLELSFDTERNKGQL